MAQIHSNDNAESLSGEGGKVENLNYQLKAAVEKAVRGCFLAEKFVCVVLCVCVCECVTVPVCWFSFEGPSTAAHSSLIGSFEFIS
jgi:hypothetical protein